MNETNENETIIKFNGVTAQRKTHLYGFAIKGDVWRHVNDIIRETNGTSSNRMETDTLYYSEDVQLYGNPLFKTILKADLVENIITEYVFKSHEDFLKALEGLKPKCENSTLKEMIQNTKYILTARKPSKIKELTKGKTTIKIGTNLYTSWGYDQTNTELFKIVSILGNSFFLIQARTGDLKQEGFMCGTLKGGDELVKNSLPLKAYISPDGYLSISEKGYKRALYIEDKKQSEHYVSWYA